MIKYLAPAIAFLLGGCSVTLPENIKPVQGLDAKRYLGTWYEIARFDHSFERGLEQVTATYSPRDDGGIRVLNRGYKTEAAKWKQAEGKAYFVESKTSGFLKVSFFGPFYAAYVIFDLSDDYRTAYITTDGEDTLWFLARTPTVSQQDKDRFLKLVASKGFDTSKVMWVPQKKG